MLPCGIEPANTKFVLLRHRMRKYGGALGVCTPLQCLRKRSYGMTTSTKRVQAYHARQVALGLRRLEVMAHPEDWPKIRALARELAALRASSRPGSG